MFVMSQVHNGIATLKQLALIIWLYEVGQLWQVVPERVKMSRSPQAKLEDCPTP